MESLDHQEPSQGGHRNCSPGLGDIIAEYFESLISVCAMLGFLSSKELFWGLLGLQVQSGCGFFVQADEGWCSKPVLKESLWVQSPPCAASCPGTAGQAPALRGSASVLGP